MDIEEARGLVAQAWCDKKNSHKRFDVDLAESLALILLERVAALEAALKKKTPPGDFLPQSND